MGNNNVWIKTTTGFYACPDGLDRLDSSYPREDAERLEAVATMQTLGGCCFCFENVVIIELFLILLLIDPSSPLAIGNPQCVVNFLMSNPLQADRDTVDEVLRLESGGLPSTSELPPLTPSPPRPSSSRSTRSSLDLLVYSCSPAKKRLKLPAAADELRQLQLTVPSSQVHSSGTADQLRRQLLSTPPKWFLFSGHGDGGVLTFTTGEAATVHVESTILTTILSSCRRLELVVLNGCETLELGRALADAGVPVIISWSTMIMDEAAAVFSVELFHALARDDTPGDDVYSRAYDQAKAAVETHLVRGKRRFELRPPEEREEAVARDQAGLPLGAGVPELLFSPESSFRLHRRGAETNASNDQ